MWRTTMLVVKDFRRYATLLMGRSDYFAVIEPEKSPITPEVGFMCV
jgi:hypothetical protein